KSLETAKKKSNKKRFQLRQSKFEPCNHPGRQCRQYSGCSCIEANIPCEPCCSCSGNCANMFLGCSCTGKCNSLKCPCFSFMQECNINQCQCCRK
ncbi:MAG: Histone-lysine N-methyltransferase ezh1, partial [Paramarteilia canceri]